ncbi:hypothetical protein I551_1929 [Mycobacterium ulcerans str. Harvey]|uniref:Uncharacterized protein n=1 Tax=Mycobacterium ulcerans str. Harvey TaxID=1299332 RepID=A0ABN0R3W3_MYCUL|nr:hypothetical protein I551_1929 [Mycobacterium ulcerans str. Harvey]
MRRATAWLLASQAWASSGSQCSIRWLRFMLASALFADGGAAFPASMR